MRRLPEHQYRRLEVKALEAGAVGRAHSHIRWEVHGKCSNPYEVSYQRSNSIAEGVIDLITPCRNCQHCLKNRQRFWAAKAGREYAASPKTWMVTLEFAPWRRRGLWAELVGVSDPAERTRKLVAASGLMCSKYLKVLRKKATIRYMMVPELHKNGMVHWHALLHTEASWRTLARAWHHGFFHAELVVGAGQIRYVTKYLAKAKYGRVRASLSYGMRPVATATEGESDPIVSSFKEELLTKSQSDWITSVMEVLQREGYLVAEE